MAAFLSSLDSNLLYNRNSAKLSIPDQLVNVEGLLKWRTNLFSTQPFWEGWYKDMSARFLDSPAIKVLMVAGRERLDTPLTIGHMQGKFQLMLFSGCGHFIHEDIPEQVQCEQFQEIMCRLLRVCTNIFNVIISSEIYQMKKHYEEELSASVLCINRVN